MTTPNTPMTEQEPFCECVNCANGMGACQSAEQELEVDGYGNPINGDSLPFCCFPDCGCDGARLCQAESGASDAALGLNFERGSFS